MTSLQNLYTLRPNGKTETYVRVCITGVHATSLHTSVFLCVYSALPRTAWIFLAFEDSFLKAPKLLHTVTMHDGRDGPTDVHVQVQKLP